MLACCSGNAHKVRVVPQEDVAAGVPDGGEAGKDPLVLRVVDKRVFMVRAGHWSCLTCKMAFHSSAVLGWLYQDLAHPVLDRLCQMVRATVLSVGVCCGAQ